MIAKRETAQNSVANSQPKVEVDSEYVSVRGEPEASRINPLSPSSVVSMGLEDHVTLESAEDTEALNLAGSSSNTSRMIYRTLTIASIITGPLFSYFLFTAICAASDETREELDLEGKFWEILFLIIAATTSSIGALADFIAVNPIEETEEMLTSAEDKELAEKLSLCNPCERITIRVFGFINQIIANSTYLVAATSDAIVVAYLSSITGLRWGLGIPLTGLGIIYYNMLNRAKVNEHAYEYIHNVLDCESSMVLNCIMTPLKSFEMVTQVLISSASRSIIFSYIIDQLLTEFFGSENDHKNDALNGLILYAAISVFYSTIFSRTLNVRKELFNPKFYGLSRVLLSSVSVSRLGLTVDVIMVGLKSGSACVLMYKHGPENSYINIPITVVLGLFLTCQGFYCRYQTRLYQTALDIQSKSDQLGQQLIRNATPEKMFDAIKEQNKTNGLKGVATFFNFGERASRWCAFLGFLFTINKIIKANTGYQLAFSDLFCIQQLLCNPTQENEFSFYQDTLIDTLAYYRTKMQLRRDPNHIGWAFFKTKSDYSKSMLSKYLREDPYVNSHVAGALEEGRGAANPPLTPQFKRAQSQAKQTTPTAVTDDATPKPTPTHAFNG
jgi:hypothetical protein